MKLEILESDEAFYFINHQDFENIFESPYVGLRKKDEVEGIGEVEFTFQDFINLLDASWNTEEREDSVELMRVGRPEDYRHEFTSVAVWEKRSINSKGNGRRGLWCLLTMNYMKRDVYDLIISMRVQNIQFIGLNTILSRNRKF